jgi:hypothetical protein
MNFGVKSRTFNILGTPDVVPGTVLSSCLEPGARVLGIISSVTTNVGDAAAWSLFVSGGGVDTIVANSNITGAGVAKTRTWFSGIDGRYNDNEILTLGASPDTQRGFWPLTMQERFIDFVASATYEVKLVIDTTAFGSIIVLYTLDSSNCYGDHA